MIKSEVVPENGFVFLRFIEPGENPETKTFITLNSPEEAEGRIRFRQRAYIIEKLISWLNQRNHALPNSRGTINMYLSWVGEVKLRSLPYVCDFVKRKRENFEAIAPGTESKFHNHYQTIILPILDFCTEYHD